MPTDRDVQHLIINKLTKAQYEAIQNPDPTQLYFIIDDNEYAEVSDLPQPSNTAPLKDGTAAAGVAATYSRSDHVHPAEIPAQSGNTGKFLTTNGTTASWASVDLSNYMVKGVDYVTAGQLAGTTLGAVATAEGWDTTASGEYSHAEGYETTASGEGSHAEGYHTTASGLRSHAEGCYTTAQRRSQHVFGEYNILDTTGSTTSEKGSYIEIVGKGTSSSARSNARTLDWSGNETLAGTLTIGGANGWTLSVDSSGNLTMLPASNSWK